MKNVLILFSGGIDSTACISYYKQRNFNIELLWVDYNYIASNNEEIAAERIASHFGLSLHKVKLAGVNWPNSRSKISGEYVGRNLSLATIAFNIFPFECGLISMGLHNGTNFIDCSRDFVIKTDSLINFLSHGCVRFDCPFIEMSKLDIIQFGLTNNVPLDITYSCENGKNPECGVCNSCSDIKTILKALKKKSLKTR